MKYYLIIIICLLSLSVVSLSSAYDTNLTIHSDRTEAFTLGELFPAQVWYAWPSSTNYYKDNGGADVAVNVTELYSVINDSKTRFTMMDVDGSCLRPDNSTWGNYSTSSAYICDLTTMQNAVKWYTENGIYIGLNFIYTPSGLRNLSSDCAANNKTCLTNDTTSFFQYMQVAIGNITNGNSTRLSMIKLAQRNNECYSSTFCLRSLTNRSQAGEYAATEYKGIQPLWHAAYPNIPLCEGNLYRGSSDGINFNLAFFRNVTNSTLEAICPHRYSTLDTADNLISDIAVVDALGFAGNPIYATELHSTSQSVLTDNETAYYWQTRTLLKLITTYGDRLKAAVTFQGTATENETESIAEFGYSHECYNQVTNHYFGCWNASKDFGNTFSRNASVNNYTKNNTNVLVLAATLTNDTAVIAITNEQNTTNNLSVTINSSIPYRQAVNIVNGTVYKISNAYNTFSINLLGYDVPSGAGTLLLSLLPYNISISSTSPSTPLTINEPDSQEFQINLTNEGNLSVLYQWYVNGTENITYFGTNNFTWDREYDGQGVWNITVVATTLTNTIEYTWILTVEELNSTASILLVANNSGTLRYANWTADLFDNGSYVMTSTATGQYTEQNFAGNSTYQTAATSWTEIITNEINGVFVRSTHPHISGIAHTADLQIGVQNQRYGQAYLKVGFNLYNGTQENTSDCTISSSSYGGCYFNVSSEGVPIRNYTIYAYATGGSPVAYPLVICASGGGNYECDYNYYTPGFLNFSSSSLLRNHNYTVIINDSNYAISSTNITTLIDVEYTTGVINLLNSNQLTLNFYDESTGELINTTVSAAFVTSDVYSNNASTSNGTLQVSLYVPAFFTITYSASGYGQREYFYNHTYLSSAELNLFLLPNTLDTLVLATVYDTSSYRVPNSYITLQKKNLSGTNYYGVEQCKTDGLGQCLLHPQLYNTTYRIIIEYLGETKLNTGDTKISNTELTFIINLANNLLQKYYQQNSLGYTLTYDNTTTEFTYTWSDGESSITDSCLVINRRVGAVISEYSNTCDGLGSAIGTITGTIDTSLRDEFTAIAYVINSDGEQIILKTFSVKTSEFQETTGQVGLFLMGFFTLGTLIFVGLYNPVVAVSMAIGGLLMLELANLINIGIAQVLAAVVIGVIAIILMRKT